MSFEKGRAKTGGRKKGTKNQSSIKKKILEFRKSDRDNLYFAFNEALNLTPAEFHRRVEEIRDTGTVAEALVYTFVSKLIQEKNLDEMKFFMDFYFSDIVLREKIDFIKELSELEK